MSRKIAKAAFFITFITLSSKLWGFVRDILIASRYGTTANSDAYIMAQSIISIVSLVLFTAIATTYIPTLSDYISNKTSSYTRRFSNNVYTVVGLGTVVISIISVILVGPIVKFFAPGFSAEAFEMTKKLTLIMMPSMILAGIVTLNNGHLQTHGRYYIPALIGYPLNAVLIFTLIFLSDSFGIVGLAVACTAGALLQLIIQLPSLKATKFSYRFELDFKNEGMRNLFILVIPTIIGTGIQQINTTVDRIIGSGLEPGSIAALNFSNRLSLFVIGLLSASIGSVFYASMSRYSADSNHDDFKNLLKNTVNTLSLIIVPASVGLIVLRTPIIKFIFERGVFDSKATEMTSTALLFFSFGLIGFALMDVLSRTFYSLKDTKTPTINASIAVIVNIALCIVLSKFLKLGGLALATSVSGIVGMLLMFISLYKKIGDYGVSEILRTFFKVCVASVIMGISVHFTYVLLESIIQSVVVDLFLSILAGMGVYYISAHFLGIEVISSLNSYVSKKFIKGSSPSQ